MSSSARASPSPSTGGSCGRRARAAPADRSTPARAGAGRRVEEPLRPRAASHQRRVGLAVLERLRLLDEVAYVRFASVYKGFDDVGDFEREVTCWPEATSPKPAPARPAARPVQSPADDTVVITVGVLCPDGLGVHSKLRVAGTGRIPHIRWCSPGASPPWWWRSAAGPPATRSGRGSRKAWRRSSGIGIRRHFTPGDPSDDEVVGSGATPASPTTRTAPSPSSSPRRVPGDWSQNATNIVAQKYFRGTLGSPERESSLRQVIDRVVDTITAWGASDGYFVDDDEAAAFRDELKYILVTQRQRSTPRCGSTSACQGVRSRRRRASSSPSTTRWTRSSTGTARRGSSSRAVRVRHQPVEDPLSRGAAEGRRHGLRPGQLHARRRRVGGHHQVGWQDPPRRQDGHPQRRPPRHRGVHLVQGDRGAQGPRAARRRLRHGPRRPRPYSIQYQNANNSVRDRRVHAGRRRRRRLAAHGRHHRRGRSNGQRATSCARSPRRRGSAPTPACSSTRRSTAGTRAEHRPHQRANHAFPGDTPECAHTDKGLDRVASCSIRAERARSSGSTRTTPRTRTIARPSVRSRRPKPS